MPNTRIRRLPPRTVTPASTPAKTEEAANTLTQLFAELRSLDARRETVLMLIELERGSKA